MRQDQVITVYARFWDYFDKNRMVVFGVLAALVVLALAAVAYGYYQQQQEKGAQALLATALGPYDQGEYRAALDGTEEHPGLLAIVDDHGGTKAGNLARYYAADALFRLGENDQALEYFNDYDKDDDLIGASAYAGEAAIYETRGDFARAGDLYRQAADANEDAFMAPQYLLNAGRAYAEAGSFEKALSAYNAIREQYPESNVAGGVDFYIARVEARQQASK